MADVFKEQAQLLSKEKKSKDIFHRVAQEDKVAFSPQERSSVSEGLKASAIGRVLGYTPDVPRGELPIGEDIGQTVTTLGADSPLMYAGGALGGMLGSALGPLGIAAGGGAGAAALPAFVREVGKYIHRVPAENEGLFDKFNALANIPAETLKAGTIGATTMSAGKLAPLLRKVPGLAKLLATKSGSALTSTLAEVAGMTGSQAAIEGEMPTARDIAKNTLLLGGMKAVGAGTRKGFGKIKEALRPGEEVTPELVRKDIDIFKEQAKKMLPKYVQKKIDTYQESKPYFELLRKNIGEKNESIVAGQFKWKALADKSNAAKNPVEMKDAIYYAQKTANPEIKGDTAEQLSTRISPETKRAVDVAREHFDTTMKKVNEHPFMDKINPREGLPEIYLPGLYDDATKIREVADTLPGLPNKPSYTNMKEFLTYEEAFKKAGVKPKYKNFFDLMKRFDSDMAKNFSRANMLQSISELEKEGGRRLILTSRDGKEYWEAKRSGAYEESQHPLLRRYDPSGIKKNPTQTAYPALVASELADAIQGIFAEHDRISANEAVQLYDNANDLLRFNRVSGGFYHYGPLLESLSSSKGGLKYALNPIRLAREGTRLRNDEGFARDMARHGMPLEKIEDFKRSKTLFGKALEIGHKMLPEKVAEAVDKGVSVARLDKISNVFGYLFKEFHPNMKAVMYKENVEYAITKRLKEGTPISDKEMFKIKTDVANLINDTFGGQNWEVQRFFNKPSRVKGMRRLFGYFDWTLSAWNQAMNVMASGTKGTLARQYWMRYLPYMAVTTGFLKWLSGGWVQTDKKNKSIKGIKFDPVKAFKELSDPDPVEWYKIALPDVEVKIGNRVMNPGRDAAEKWKKSGIGTRLYTHPGKQMFEVKGWFTHPFQTLSTKFSPLIAMAQQQLIESTPSEYDEPFTVRGKYSKANRKFLPWDNTVPGSKKRKASRIAALGEGVLPFAIKSGYDHGIDTYLATALGSVPISEGTTPFKAKYALVDAIINKDTAKINRIKRALKENGFSQKDFKSSMNFARQKAKERMATKTKRVGLYRE